jgi:hypothetical protein
MSFDDLFRKDRPDKTLQPRRRATGISFYVVGSSFRMIIHLAQAGRTDAEKSERSGGVDPKTETWKMVRVLGRRTHVTTEAG